MTSQVSFKGMHAKLVMLARLGGIIRSNLSPIAPNPLAIGILIVFRKLYNPWGCSHDDPF